MKAQFTTTANIMIFWNATLCGLVSFGKHAAPILIAEHRDRRFLQSAGAYQPNCTASCSFTTNKHVAMGTVYSVLEYRIKQSLFVLGKADLHTYETKSWVEFSAHSSLELQLKTRSSGKNRLLSFDTTSNTENYASSNSSTAACLLFAAGTCLPNRCLSTMGRNNTHTKIQNKAMLMLAFKNRENGLKTFGVAYT